MKGWYCRIWAKYFKIKNFPPVQRHLTVHVKRSEETVMAQPLYFDLYFTDSREPLLEILLIFAADISCESNLLLSKNSAVRLRLQTIRCQRKVLEMVHIRFIFCCFTLTKRQTVTASLRKLFADTFNIALTKCGPFSHFLNPGICFQENVSD